ncbi:DNA repair protein RadA [Litorihabitans aurantiacus]|uniref:DNA repair protein RadA n=1 Tax=Litorihabitans aurantiacus TaxID=1930061 RepID=UPI0024E0E4CE|nr:DNA repair protein RadA [Litorihabitans aurantiacus]
MATRATRSPRAAWECSECGWRAAKWVGRCAECQAWGTVVEAGGPAATRSATAATPPRSPARPIDEVEIALVATRTSGVGELDRVLGGGLVPGAVILMAGEPGVGKSTLLLDVAGRTARSGTRALYITGEESAAQVRLRAQRIGAVHPDLMLAAEADLGTVLGHVEAVDPGLLILDSVQTIASAGVEGAAGGVAQVREVAAGVIAAAKERHLPVVLVGHVTKDGGIAGPRVLEHLVDVVCQFEGDRHSRLRMVRAVKNRYGPTDEVGCFDLSDTGITGLADPSGLFLSERATGEPGTCVTITLDGARPMPIEVQALVAPSATPHPRRATSGVESARVSMTLAVLESRLRLGLSASDVYVSTIGGARAQEPSSDVAVALALASAHRRAPLRRGLVAVGEVSLTGQLRPITGLERRLGEANRLGFTQAVVPASARGGLRAPAGMTVHFAEDLRTAWEAASEPVQELRGTGSD